MRYVARDNKQIPDILVSRRTRDAIDDIHLYLRRSQDDISQTRSPFQENLVFNEEVKASLGRVFYEKCAYCETSVSFSEAGIDHFRPIDVSEETPTNQGHYAWLAYDWENLYLACPACQSRKGARFPVYGQRGRPFSTVSEARSVETPALLDPYDDNPRLHIRLQPDGYYLPRTQSGRETVEFFELNRADLVSDRMSVIEELGDAFRRGVDRFILEAAISPKGPYSGAKTQYIGLVIEAVTGRHPNWGKTGPVFGGVLAALQNTDTEVLKRKIDDLNSGSYRLPTGAIARRVFGGPALDVSALTDRRFTPESVLETSIQNIRISNFKGIDELFLTLPAFRPGRRSSGALMLLGENAVGKTSVLEAITLALLGQDDAEGMVAPENILRRKGKERQELIEPDTTSVELSFYDRSSQSVLTIDPLSRRLEGEPYASSVVIAYGPRRYSDETAKWHRGRSARVKSLFQAAVPLADPTAWLREIASDDVSRFKAVARGLREILALRDGDNLVLDKAMGVCVSVRGRLEPVSRLSEGYRSLFVMSVDMMRELLRKQSDLEDARGVVLIDEIETHLHPRWKMRVMSALRRAMPKVTFIATTHDPLCLRGMEQGEVVVLAKDSDQKIYQVADLPNISGMRVEQILTSDYFGLNSTADPETEAELTAYVAAVAREQAGDEEAVGQVTRLAASLRETLVLGETAADQLAQEALRRFLKERHDLSSIERSSSRREVVEAMLSALRQPLVE